MRKADRTKQFIIETVAPIFNQKGVAGTSVSDITSATKLAAGGIYRHFDNKEAISLEVFTYLSNQTHDAVTGVVRELKTAKDKLFGLLDFYDKRLLSRAGGCAIMNFGAEADDTNPAMKQKIKEAIQRFKGRITKIIHDGQETGEFSRDFNADLFAIKAFTMIEGAVLICKIEDSTEHMHTVIALLKKEIEPYML